MCGTQLSEIRSKMDVNEKVDDIVWNAYAMQSSLGHDAIVILPDNKRIYVLGSIVAARAFALVNLMNHEVFPREIDLSGSEVPSGSLLSVLDYIHGALDPDDRPRITFAKDYPTLFSLLEAADYCGAEKCKSWVESRLIEDHVASLGAQDLQRLTEDARARNAVNLYEAAGRELAQRAPVDILASADSQLLAELMDRHLPKRACRNQELAAGVRSGKLILLDSATGVGLKTIDAHTESVNCLTYSSDGSMLASCSNDASIKIWSSDTYESLRVFEAAHTGVIHQIGFSVKGETMLASVSDDHCCKIWNPVTGACMKSLDHGTFVYSMAYSPTRPAQVATGDWNGNVRLCETQSEDFQLLQGHQGPVISIAYGRDGLTMVSGGMTMVAGASSTCILWDLVTPTRLRTFEHPGLWKVSISPDSSSIASISNESLKVWHGYTGALLEELRSDSGYGLWDRSTLAYSPDGCLIAHGRYYMTDKKWKIVLRDVSTYEIVRIIDIDHEAYGTPYSLLFRPPLP